MFDWLGDFFNGIGDAIGGAFNGVGSAISEAIWEAMLQWYYETIYNAIADFLHSLDDKKKVDVYINSGGEMYSAVWRYIISCRGIREKTSHTLTA